MVKKMKELKEILNNASKYYYNGQSIISDKQWDSLYDEYVKLESESGIILSDSPTQNVGYEIISKLMWLIQIYITSKMQKNKPESVQKLINFQLKAIGVLQ